MYLDSLVEGYSGRLLFLSGFCIFMFGVLEASLWNVQVKLGDDHRAKISTQSMRNVRVSPVRGRILTSDGEVVADTTPVFDVVLHVSEMRQPGKRSETVDYVAKKIIESAAIMGRTPEAVSQSNLKKLTIDSFNFSKGRFAHFWNSSVDVKKKYFSGMTKDEAWTKISADREFAAGFEEEVSILFKSSFRKIATARSISERVYQVLKSGRYDVKLAELSEYVHAERELERQNVAKRVTKKEISQEAANEKNASIDKVLRTVDEDLTPNSTWQKLRTSWRWRKGIISVMTAQDLIKVLGKKYSELVKASVVAHITAAPALPYKAFLDITSQELGAISEALHSIQGLEVQVNCQREYPFSDFGSHFLGITGKKKPVRKKVSDDKDEESFFYVLPELVGRSGLEATYDKYLSGKPGSKVVQVDTMGYSHDVIKEKKAINGSELLLNIDSNAQIAAQKALANIKVREGKEKKAAVVLLDCRNGAVLAMASYPTFSLADFDYTKLNADKENKPLLNRAMSERYAPGSTVKPMIALAALQAQSIQPDLVVDCDGVHYSMPEKRKGRTRCHSWKSGGHGPVDVLGAIEQSCNPFFCTVGIETTFDVLRPYMQKAGFGTKTGLDLIPTGMMSGEIAGYLPSRESKRKITGIPWNSTNTAQFSIGQSDLGVTLLQIACYVSAIANGGTIYEPRFVNSVLNPDGSVIKTFKPQIKSHLGIDDAYLDLVRQGMYQVVWGDKPGVPVKVGMRDAPITLAGKTGTAEVGTRSNPRKNTWFMCYGPVENPKYACVVLVERGRFGGTSSAPVALDLFNNWLGAKSDDK